MDLSRRTKICGWVSRPAGRNRGIHSRRVGGQHSGGDFFAPRRRRPGRNGLVRRSDHTGHHGASGSRLMPKLRTLSGGDLIRMFARFGFREISRRGSHVKLRRVLVNGVRENLTVPPHENLDRGPWKAIYRQASHYIREAEQRPHFYTNGGPPAPPTTKKSPEGPG